MRWVWRRTPLWMRLVAGALALAALGLTVTGAIGVSLLRDYLISQNGQQLRAFGSAVADARRAHTGSSLNCGGLPNDNATELVDARFASRLISSCPAWVKSAGGVIPDLPSPSTLVQAARSGEAFVMTNHSRPSLSWEVVVVPMEYHVSRAVAKSAVAGQNGILGTTQNGKSGTVLVTAHGYVLVATSLTYVDATVAQMIRLEIAVDSVVGAVLVLLGYAIVRTALRPLSQIETAAEAISAGDLSRRVPGGHPKTETGRLSSALNGMLGQIEAAFSAREHSEAAARDSEQRMRQFIADASHELRTPLTSIRGFAELYRQGAADWSQMPDLIRRIEQEALRMGVLVEDLLLLARLDQQRPLARDRVHLAALAVESIAGARARDPQRLIDLKTERPAGAGEPVVIGDETRLRQALDNLLDNALRYTPPDARISVRIHPDRCPAPRQYLLEVADTGPGLGAHEAAHVFERFYRADPSRTRSDADRGSGLGLAIVAAIVAAHGGTASVHTAPGQGALFRLALPAAEPSSGDPERESDADDASFDELVGEPVPSSDGPPASEEFAAG